MPLQFFLKGLTEQTDVEKKTLTDISSLLASLEEFEVNPDAVRATEVRQALAVVEKSGFLEFPTLRQAVIHHYAAPNFRVALDEIFLTRLMPEAPSRTETVRDVILGKPVRGRRVVEQITSVDLTPDADEICFDLTVDGHVSTYAITETGPIALTSRGSGQFTVKKPIKNLSRRSHCWPICSFGVEPRSPHECFYKFRFCTAHGFLAANTCSQSTCGQSPRSKSRSCSKNRLAVMS